MVDLAHRGAVADTPGPATDELEAEVTADTAPVQASVDVAALGRRLLGSWADVRTRGRALAADPALHPSPV